MNALLAWLVVGILGCGLLLLVLFALVVGRLLRVNREQKQQIAVLKELRDAEKLRSISERRK